MSGSASASHIGVSPIRRKSTFSAWFGRLKPVSEKLFRDGNRALRGTTAKDDGDDGDNKGKDDDDGKDGDSISSPIKEDEKQGKNAARVFLGGSDAAQGFAKNDEAAVGVAQSPTIETAAGDRDVCLPHAAAQARILDEASGKEVVGPHAVDLDLAVQLELSERVHLPIEKAQVEKIPLALEGILACAFDDAANELVGQSGEGAVLHGGGGRIGSSDVGDSWLADEKKRVGRRREAESGYRVDDEEDCGRDRDEYAQGEREGRRRAKTEAAVGSGDEG
ncbi:hypothetical protein CGCSCA5_v012896 [Colletotrichum siamense]|nr:hypothetical protein CGCSCA5_v012896 [Colletotrichum siamense]